MILKLKLQFSFIFLLCCLIIRASVDEDNKPEKRSNEATVDVLQKDDLLLDGTKNKPQTIKGTISETLEKETTQSSKPGPENVERAKLAAEQNPNDLLNMFGSMFGDGGFIEGLMAGEENGKENPLKNFMPLVKTFGDTLSKQIADAEKEKKNEVEAERQTQPDLSSLVNMFSGFINAQYKDENQNKDDVRNLKTTLNENEGQKTYKIDQKQGTEQIVEELKDFVNNKENAEEKIEERSTEENKQDLFDKILDKIIPQKTALDLIPYLLQDKLSDDVKNKLKEVTEADILALKKVNADIENIENFEDIPKKIKQVAPKVYKTSVEVYSQAQLQFAKFVHSLNKEPQNLINELIKDVKSLGQKYFNEVTEMSMESLQNIQKAVTERSPELGELLKRLFMSKAAVLWIMNNMLQKEFDEIDQKKGPDANEKSDHKEL